MNGNYSFSPSLWLPLITFIFMVALAIYGWRQRRVSGSLPFSVGCLFAALWIAGAFMEIAAVEVPTKILWVKFQAVWQLPTVTAFTCFILEYAWPGRWLTRRNLVLLAIPTLLYWGLVLTNNLHLLIWGGFTFDGSVKPLRGLVNWVFITFGFALGIVNIIVLVWLFLRSPQHRWPAAIMLTGQIIARLLYMLKITDSIHSNELLIVYLLAIQSSVYAVALFGFRILDPARLARQNAIEQLHTGMLVLDTHGRVVSLNPAAESILHMPEEQAVGKLIWDLLPLNPDTLLADQSETEIEFSLRTDVDVRHYNLEISPLKDWHGLDVGRMLLLHDVTEQKQAQEEIIEQMWAQATLQEREQLANELHDNIAQDLAFLNLQAQTAQVLMRANKSKAAQASLERLTEAAGQIQDDTRGLIGDLLAVNLPAENFCVTLRQILGRFEGQTGIPACLEIRGVSEDCFDANRMSPPVAVQLIRIAQEALVNVRKHARGASKVSVELAASDGQLLMSISDDGVGYDPTVKPSGENQFGLQVMRQRALRIGGEISYTSSPTMGMRIDVSAPLTINGNRDKA